jgi:hypothetical protein
LRRQKLWIGSKAKTEKTKLLKGTRAALFYKMQMAFETGCSNATKEETEDASSFSSSSYYDSCCARNI